MSSEHGAGTTDVARRDRARFTAAFGDLRRWRELPVTDQMAGHPAARAFANFAAVHAGRAVDAGYVAAAASKWGRHVAARDADQAARFPGCRPPASGSAGSRSKRCGRNLPGSV
ncbi:hypothetical protein [Rhodococcus ruber]|uniref:hypothetical protein n=1 Tax=Rhodococcus ruber TaxID=1830 RepID=UPI00315DE15D